MTTENNQIPDTEATNVVPRKYKLLTERGMEDTVIPIQDYEKLTDIIAQELGENEVAIEGLGGIKVRDALDIWEKMGASNPTSETLLHRYFQGRALQTEEPQILSEIVKSKASSLERRLLGIHERIDTLNYKAEEEIPLVEDGKVKGHVRFVTRVNTGNTKDMSVEIYDSTKKGYGRNYLFGIKIQEPKKPGAKDSYYIGNVLHNIFVLPFKYAAYQTKRAVNFVRKRHRELKVIIDYGGKPLPLEDFLGGVVGRTDSDEYYDKMIRFAIKNLVPALERDLTQAQDYANGLEV